MTAQIVALHSDKAQLPLPAALTRSLRSATGLWRIDRRMVEVIAGYMR